MERFYFEVPGIERKDEALAYINEFYEHKSNINGAGGLAKFLKDYEGWLRMSEAYALMNVNPRRCPAREFFLVRESDNRIVGMINIRIALNEKNKKYGGHIGYSIRPTERGKGYNNINLYLGLKVCNQYGIETVFMDADLDNPASWKTMEAFGGVRVREYFDDEDAHCVVVDYNIDTKKALAEHAEYEAYVAPFRLETGRLVLRQMTMDDYDALYAVLGDPEIMQHYPYSFDEERVRGWIRRNCDRYQQYGFGLWAVCRKDTGEMIGDCGLTLQNIDGELLPEIGYHVRRDMQHKGYAKEAAAAVRDWAFRHTSYPALYSYCKYTNVASYKTAESIGMTFLRDYPDEDNGITHVSVIRRSEVVPCADRGWLLSEEAYLVYAACMYQPTFSKYRDQMAKYIASPSVSVYVYRTESGVSGMLVLEERESGAEILGISVAGSCRKIGIGRKMVLAVAESGRFSPLYAQTDEEGVDFYRSCGFTAEQRIVQYPNGEVMRYDCRLKK